MVNIPIYINEELYNKCTSQKVENFDELNSPTYRIIHTISKLVDKSEKLRLCIIDEEYVDFVVKNGLEFTPEAMTIYMDKMSNDKAKSLWENSKFSYSIEMLMLPFLSINESIEKRTFYNVDDERKELLKSLIKETYKIKDEDIFIPGYVLSFEKMIESQESLFSIGKSFLIDGKKIRYDILFEQENCVDANIFLYCIPFFYKKPVNYIVSNDFVLQYFLSQEEGFENTKIDLEKIISINSCTNLKIVDEFVRVEELENIHNEIEEMIQKTFRKKNIFSRLFNKIFSNKKEPV